MELKFILKKISSDEMRPAIINVNKEELSNLYTKIPTTQIAKRYRCSRSTILRRLHEFGLSVRSPYKYINIPKNELEKLYYEGKSSRKIADAFNCNYGTVLNRLHEHNIKIRDVSEAHIIYPKNDFSGNLVEKAYMIGFRLGDLYVGKFEENGKIMAIMCASTKIEQIKLINELFKKYGYVRINPPDKKGIIKICVNLNESFNFLLEKCDDIKNWVMTNDMYFLAFFAGYTDAEGCIFTNKKGISSFRLRSYDKNILKRSVEKLENLGISDIDFGLEKRKKKSKEWRLGIYSKKSLLKLFILIEKLILHEKRKNDLKIAKKSILKRNRKYGNLRMKEK